MLDEPLERTTNSSHANGAAQAPRSMQWAVRNTQNQRTTSTAPSSTSAPAGKNDDWTMFMHTDSAIYIASNNNTHGVFCLSLLWLISKWIESPFCENGAQIHS